MNAIAIDGPAASGKSTVGYRVGQRLGFVFFDTGVMYRAVAWAVLEQGIDSADGEAVGRLAEQLRIEVDAPASDLSDGRQATILVGQADVTWEIRSTRVDSIVSVVAANARVRRELTRKQRGVGLAYGSGAAGKAGVVMVGRDVGTVLLPEAPLKIYLQAPLEERARRRLRELVERGREADFDQILEDMRIRDRTDSHRAVAPLRPAEDAVQIQTLGLTVEEVVEQILALTTARLGVTPSSPDE